MVEILIFGILLAHDSNIPDRRVKERGCVETFGPVYRKIAGIQDV